MSDPRESASRLLRFRQALERLIEDAVPGPGDSVAGPVVPVDVFVRAEAVEVLVEVPGFRPEHLEVHAAGPHLVLEGYRPAAPGLPGSVLCLERPVGRFRRVIDVPVAIDGHLATGVLRDGVLTVTLPRIRDRRGSTRRVPIVTGERP